MRWLIACAAVAGCGDNITPHPPDPLAPVTLVDTNPDPGIVEVSLVAATGTVELRAGAPADVWGYRDGSVKGSAVSVPGPTLDVHQGDQVIVHFTNQLPEATT